MIRSGERAFTLIEVMILIVIGIILASVALPAAHTLDDQRVAAVARILASDVEFAQARAMATGQAHRVLFQPLSNRYQVESPPGTLLDEPLAKIPWVRSISASQGVTLVSANFNGGAALVFDGAGRPQAGGTVIFQRTQFQAVLTVEAVTGRVSLTLP